jgi:hypothetical protein
MIYRNTIKSFIVRWLVLSYVPSNSKDRGITIMIAAVAGLMVGASTFIEQIVKAQNMTINMTDMKKPRISHSAYKLMHLPRII